MWPPLIQICARPSQPLLPYAALQERTLPLTAGQRFRVFVLSFPASLLTLRTDDACQSLMAMTRLSSQLDVMLSMTLTVNGLDVRAQWYPFQEWLAWAVAGMAARIARD